jgi:hypothetical protein
MRVKSRRHPTWVPSPVKQKYQEQRGCVVKRIANITFVFLVVVTALCLLCTQVVAGNGACRSTGQIETVDSTRGIVSVEVLIGDTHCTIGGGLCPGAVLKKGGEPAALADFSAGDQVLVEWRITNKECIIEALEAN